MITWTRKVSSIIKKINKDLLFENKQNPKSHLKLVETKMNKDDTTIFIRHKISWDKQKSNKECIS